MKTVLFCTNSPGKGEIGKEEKNKISMRKKALEKLKEILDTTRITG